MATPWRATAACSWASARRMSGRRRARSEGRPTGTMPAGAAGWPRRLSSSASSAPGFSGQQQAELVLVGGDLWSSGGSCGLRAGRGGGGRGDVEVVAEPCRAGVLREAQQGPGGGQRLGR